jgi:hypothetical protein
MQALFELFSAFNRGSLDVPAGLFTPKTAFSLNGRRYESLLGGSPDDPLIRLLARGAAGYRTAAKALHYGLQQPVISIESLSDADASGARTVTIRVEGRLRPSGAAFDGRAALHLEGTDHQIDSLDVTCSDEDLERIASSRKA